MAWNWQRAVWRWGMWESMQPGGFTGQENVDCPYCGTTLDVEVTHRYGSDAYQCCECGGAFEVDWRDGTVTYNAPEEWE
jgi:DNA-directed RNA polymerase subunit RPC12/RpoP